MYARMYMYACMSVVFLQGVQGVPDTQNGWRPPFGHPKYFKIRLLGVRMDTQLFPSCVHLSQVLLGKHGRDFSVLNETKTSKRAILGNKHLANQMRVILSGVPLEEFDDHQAVNKWLSFKKSRRGLLEMDD